ncbi:MAG: hypothetical protein ACRDTS_01845 [Mycobacterium sp.]
MDVEQAAGLPQAAADTAVVGQRRAYLVMCLLLLAQFVSGMFVNLFVQIPDHHPGAKPIAYFSGAATSVSWALGHGGGFLTVHVALGLALIVVGIAALVFALRVGGAGPLITAIVGFLAILGAAFNGASFLNYDEDLSSMIMAGCFAVALACYTIGLYQHSKPTVTPHNPHHAR